MEQDIAGLGKAVKARRKQLRLRQSDLAKRGGPSDTTVSKIEHAQTDHIHPSTAKALDTSLAWPSGTAADYLAGRTPQEAPSPKEPLVQDLLRQAREMQERLDAAVREAPAELAEYPDYVRNVQVPERDDEFHYAIMRWVLELQRRLDALEGRRRTLHGGGSIRPEVFGSPDLVWAGQDDSDTSLEVDVVRVRPTGATS